MSAVSLLFEPISERQIYLEKKKTNPKHVEKKKTIAEKAHFELYAHLFTVFPVLHFSIDQSTSSKTVEKCYTESCKHKGIFTESPLEKKVK